VEVPGIRIRIRSYVGSIMRLNRADERWRCLLQDYETM